MSDLLTSIDNIRECQTEASCEIVNSLLDRPSILSANKAFDLSYKNYDKTKFEVEEKYLKVFELIAEKAEKGEFYVSLTSSTWYPDTFIKYLEELGYEVILYVYDNNSIYKRIAHIDWETRSWR